MWGISINRQSEITLVRQVYQKIREGILNGQIQAGEALPSTREFAKLLSVSRNTVCEAYDLLLAEGYVINRQGAPTRVAEGLCIKQKPAKSSCCLTKNISRPILVDFKTGKPDLKYFPRFVWKQLMQKSLEELSLTRLGYSGPEGDLRLRQEISAWLYRSRGMQVDFQDIFITAGATHALHLLTSLLYKEGSHLLIEDPCHIGMLHALQAKAIPVIPVPVDDKGLMVEELDGKNAFALYVTPSHQFPLGGILPAGRRAAIIKVARENDFYVIEDDYDSEFRYCGEPVAPLYASSPEQVIYVGTFSKILFPALRIGYVILPRKLHKKWCFLRTHTDVQNPPFEQAALAEYLASRKLDGHVKRMRNLYARRRQWLLNELGVMFGMNWRPCGDAAGLHLAISFPGMIFDEGFEKKCRLNGIRITTVDYHSIRKGVHLDKLLFGYGHLEHDEIRKGVQLLHHVMKRQLE